MIAYLAKSIICLGILLLVYLLFLEKEKMHSFNRWYLLGSIVFACFVPLVSFTVPQASLPPVLQHNYFDVFSNNTVKDQELTSTQNIIPIMPSPKSAVDFALIIYSLITLVLLTRFARNIYRLLSDASKHKTIAYRGASLVLLKEKTASYSFLHYIFISEQDYADKKIEEELITHELTHVREKHSWDVIFIELLQAVCWFNPMFIFYKKAIQLNHEYLADEAVVKTYDDVHAYQYLLLDKASCSSHAHLTSNFNYSVTKKRLIMMTKNYNKVRSLFKKMAVLPLLAAVFLFFSAKEILAQEKKQEKAKAPGVKGDENAREMTFMISAFPYGAGASTEEMTEYNAIIDKNIEVTKNGHKVLPHVNDTERARLLEIFKHMDKTQRTEGRAAFMKRGNPAAPKHPSPELYEKFKDADTYGVWIGAKKVNNEELNKYKAEDFGSYSVSNLNYTEQMKKDVMNTFHLTKMYKYQLNLMTNKDYDAYYKSTMASPPQYLVFRMNSTPNRPVLVPVN